MPSMGSWISVVDEVVDILPGSIPAMMILAG
jgi:hypothetical protein